MAIISAIFFSASCMSLARANAERDALQSAFSRLDGVKVQAYPGHVNVLFPGETKDTCLVRLVVVKGVDGEARGRICLAKHGKRNLEWEFFFHHIVGPCGVGIEDVPAQNNFKIRHRRFVWSESSAELQASFIHDAWICHHDLNFHHSLQLSSKRTAIFNFGEGQISGKMLRDAAASGDAWTLRWLMICSPRTVLEADHLGFTPLHKACQHAKPRCVELLCCHMSKEERAAVTKRGDTALHLAIYGWIKGTQGHTKPSDRRDFHECAKLVLGWSGSMYHYDDNPTKLMDLLHVPRADGVSALDWARRKGQPFDFDWIPPSASANATPTTSSQAESTRKRSVDATTTQARKRPVPAPAASPLERVAAAPSKDDDNCPLICSIALEHMEAPVTLSCGCNFEMQAIKEWLAKESTCPNCRQPVPRGFDPESLKVNRTIMHFVACTCRARAGGAARPVGTPARGRARGRIGGA